MLINIPYVHLMNIFGYDDVLREPADGVLRRFAAGGDELILTWLVFGVAALLFAPISALIRRTLSTGDGRGWEFTEVLGSLSAGAQACGLLRWTFVIPTLATAYIDPSATPATREAILVAYAVVHQFGGVLLGEFLGQTLLAGWTLAVALQLPKSSWPTKALAYGGYGIAALWVVAQAETLSTILTSIQVPELVPFAFIGWQCWFLALGIHLMLSKRAEA